MNIDQLNNDVDDLQHYDSFYCSPDECLSYIDPTRNSLKIFHVNIRSINRNFDELTLFLNRLDLNPDIIILTECWLSKVVNIPDLIGFNSHRSTTQNQNDGVIIFVKTQITCDVLVSSLCDASGLTFTYKNTIAFVAVYRSPANKNIDNFLISLNNLITSLAAYETIAVIGDININILCDTNDPKSESYLNLLASHGLLPAHSFITHDKSCLDHIMLRSNRKAVTLVFDSGFTDHAPILTCIDQNKNISHSSIHSRINYQNVVNEIAQTDFSPILSCKNANIAAEMLVSNISMCIVHNTSVVRVSCRKRITKPWITPGILRCIRNRDRLHKMVKNNKNNVIIKITFLRYRNFCNKLLKKLKRIYEQNELQKAKHNPKATWNVIKNISNLRTKSLPSKELLNLTSAPKTSLNMVNKYFGNIGYHLASGVRQAQQFSTISINKPSLPDNVNLLGNSMALLETTESEVDNVIAGLRADSAVGYDGISSTCS
ncbi:uncharacterized protein LOC113233065 [Hyposmocoma kahamanoa]|uniref:uncharacterized protein LOC113231746 n=1 Tax=Hyposmocoma kahamanoa TaxID=1477025 RepID=UPI000E6D7660|nr:uncharacterized protein LOC113231746 [Hyposmocoma kahamanoa]XP_026323816.1 uncharacterized protein LOC113233065 [Hyposmocoma kahamanoa]